MDLSITIASLVTALKILAATAGLLMLVIGIMMEVLFIAYLVKGNRRKE